MSEKSEDFAPFAGILLPVLCSSHRGSPAARPKARRAPSLGHRQPRRCSEPLVLRSEPRAGLRAPTARAPRRPFRAGHALPPPFPQDSSQGFRCPMEARTLVRCSVRCSTSSLGNWLPRSQFWEPFPSWPPGTVSHRDWTARATRVPAGSVGQGSVRSTLVGNYHRDLRWGISTYTHLGEWGQLTSRL